MFAGLFRHRAGSIDLTLRAPGWQASVEEEAACTRPADVGKLTSCGLGGRRYSPFALPRSYPRERLSPAIVGGRNYRDVEAVVVTANERSGRAHISFLRPLPPPCPPRHPVPTSPTPHPKSITIKENGSDSLQSGFQLRVYCPTNTTSCSLVLLHGPLLLAASSSLVPAPLLHCSG